MRDSSGKGSFVLSIDTELAWGSVHSGAYHTRAGQYRRTREVIAQLLDLQERYNIRATWAVVGHLFLDQCRPVDGVKHPEIVRPSYGWFHGDWFDADPCGDMESDPFWYGPDIVARIRECKVPQEIGSHGFSHMIVGDPGCSRECFDSEMRTAVDLAQRSGFDLKSFIYPRNSEGHMDVLAANGFTTYRGMTPAWFARIPGPLGKLGHLADMLTPVAPPVVKPRKTGDLWDIPASYFYPHRDGWAKWIPPGISVRKSKLGLNKAVRQRSIFHLWFHPFNLASDPEVLLQGLEEIFQHVDQLRDEGKLLNPSMGDLAESLQQGRQEVTR